MSLINSKIRSVVSRLSFCVVLALLATACLDTIRLDVPNEFQNSIAIQGNIIMGEPSVVQATVSQLFDFSLASRKPLNVRDIFISDEAGNTLDLETVDLGEYRLEIPENHPSFRVEVGGKYQLNVALFDGREYQSRLEEILPVPETKNLEASIITKQVAGGLDNQVDAQFVQFAIDTRIALAESGEKSRVRWVVQRTFQVTDTPDDPTIEQKTCYITQNAELSTIQVFDGNDVGVETIENVPLFEERIGSRFAEGYALTVFQQSLTLDAFNYWSEVNEVVERTGNMFEAPAGKVRSNIRNINDPEEQAFGYFYATAQDTVREFVTSEFVGSPVPACPPNVPPSPGGGCPVTVCCNCLDEPGSTTVRPEFWQE